MSHRKARIALVVCALGGGWLAGVVFPQPTGRNEIDFTLAIPHIEKLTNGTTGNRWTLEQFTEIFHNAEGSDLWEPDGPGFPHMIIVQQWAEDDPGSALRWALTLPQGISRDYTLANVVRSWAAADVEAAIAWAQSLPAKSVPEPVWNEIVDALLPLDPERAMSLLVPEQRPRIFEWLARDSIHGTGHGRGQTLATFAEHFQDQDLDQIATEIAWRDFLRSATASRSRD